MTTQIFAYNAHGDTFTNPNWNGIEAAARRALDRTVATDGLHHKNGPWQFRAIDVSPSF